MWLEKDKKKKTAVNYIILNVDHLFSFPYFTEP